MTSVSVNVLTPPRLGGPFTWAKNLVYKLKQKEIQSNHIYKSMDLLISPFFQEADVVHTAFPLSVKFYRKPIIFTLHGEYSIENRIWIYPTKIAIKTADALTVPSHFLKEKLSLEDAIVIPNAVEPEYFTMVNHQKKSQINIISVTNFSFRDKSEGVIRLIKILDDLQGSTDIKIRYSVAGSGKYLDYVKRSTQNSVIVPTFTGFITDIRSFLTTGDIFCYYSTHDNFPTVLPEAMAAGLPIVTNNIGAIPEIIASKNEGYVCETDDYYKECLLKLIDDENLRSKTGANSRIRVEKKFNWNTCVYDYISLYEDVLDIN